MINNEVEFYLTDLKSRFDKIKHNKYYLSYSGGVDSHFLYWFIKDYLRRDDIKIVGCNTYMEHQEILQRINKNSDIVLFPTKKPFDIKKEYGIPCFSKMQDSIIDRYQRGSRAKSTMERIIGLDDKGRDWTKFKLNNTAKTKLLDGTLHRVSPNCCKYLKKEVAHKFEKESGLKAILGVRGSESALRSSKYKSCFTKDRKFTPIYDLSDELLYKIIKQYDIEVPEVYKHISRTGCMGCPYGSYKKETTKELMLVNDNQFEFVCKYFKESYEVLGIDVNKIREQRRIEKEV